MMTFQRKTRAGDCVCLLCRPLLREEVHRGLLVNRRKGGVIQAVITAHVYCGAGGARTMAESSLFGTG